MDKSDGADLSRRVWRLLGAYMLRDKWLLFVALLSAIGLSGTGLLSAKIMSDLFDALKVGNAAKLNLYSLAIVGVYVVRWFFVYGEMVYFAEAGQRLGLRLRSAIYTHLQSLSLRFFNKQRTGALMSTINNDVPLLQSSIASLKDLAPAPFQVIGGIAICIWISPKLSLAAMIVIPLMAAIINWLTKQIKGITSRTQDKLSDVNTIMEETLSGIRVIQSFSAEQHEIARFDRENHNAKELFMQSVRRQANLKPSVDVIGAIGISFALWVGGNLVVGHQLSFAHLVYFIGLLNQVAVGLNGLGGAKVTWEQIRAASERILDNVLDVEPDIRSAPDAVSLPEIQGLIEFRNVDFAYVPGTPVLSNISFTMNPGEVVAVVGKTGSGKSTIADLIPRFYDPDAGSVTVDGHDLRAVTVQSLRKHIAIVPQETMLFGGTIRDNIAYGNPDATDEMVEQAARAANAHDFISNPNVLPDGYNTIVGERGKQLSGGQRQRVAIARALIKNPRILILDEATSALDNQSETLVQQALDELMQGRTTLVIAHRLSTVVNADRILVMQNGRIAESGTHAELLRIPDGIYAQLYETQFRWEVETPQVGAPL
ncbi:ABC transporter ATP-binding protein [Capsulimonas corticalis]|uniref:ABC transporter ATP-binding protein n=1 Tax=Capsulimonas corticalis TaxID=2219043 RepID=A0A402CPI9_9BACT|nr:ABC transporter ATP-binding protein [Capsulimonas corticalis]BDI33053.1 ABC transporter ATP-binding protein [Capsulimonas corticalis]